MTLATLTGHEVLTYGEGYSAILENGPARQVKEGEQLQRAGEDVGDMVEISRIRREVPIHDSDIADVSYVLQ